MGRPSGFGDAEAKRIIERAAELDAQDQKQLDASALREIAVEAGISPASVDRALEELAAPPPLRRRSWLLRHPGLVIGTTVVLVFLLMRLFP